MQLMPGTADRYGVRNRFDPEENVEGGARYLSDLIGMFQSDIRLAVAAYNSGENTVKKFGYQVPPIPETQDYVVRVLNYYRRHAPL
jgi:soluble lytic murein transglycosylase-like protein